MMRLLLLLCALQLCLPALAEAPLDSDGVTRIDRSAMVNGVIYGMTSTSGWNARTTLYCMTEDGMETVWQGEGYCRAIYALGEKLLLVSERKSFWEDLLEFYEKPGERFVQVVDPATWRAETLFIPDDGGQIVALNGQIVRWSERSAESGDMLQTRVTLQRWNDDGWELFFAWQGEGEKKGRFGSELHPDFIVLERRETGRWTCDMRIATLPDGREYLLTGVANEAVRGVEAVIEDGVMYYLGFDGEKCTLHACDLAAGTQQLLITLPVPYYEGFMLTADSVVLMQSWEALEVYDRGSQALRRIIAIPNGTRDWFMRGDEVWMIDYENSSSVEGGQVVRRVKPSSSVVDLRSGECHTVPFAH